MFRVCGYRGGMKKLVAGVATWAFIVFIPAHISFAMSQYNPQQYGSGHWGGGYGRSQSHYQLYWCNGYYSYSPCSYSYSYPMTYYYSQYYPYYQQYYYPYGNTYSYGSNVNTNSNYNFNYNNVGAYWW